MILGSRKPLVELKASIALLVDSIESNTHELKSISVKQTEVIRQLERLSRANEEFIRVIENFFAIEKKIHLEEAKRREKRELDNTPTGADSRY